MTLRRRLLLFSLGQALVLGGLFAALWLVVHFQAMPTLKDHLEAHVGGAASQSAAALEVPLAAGDSTAIADALAPLVGASDFHSVVVRDEEGRLVYSTSERPGERLFEQTPNVPFWDKDRVAAWSPVEFEGMALGSVGATFTTARLEDLEAWMWTGLFVALLALSLTSVAAVRFSFQFVAPIQAMMGFSGRVAHGEFDQRLEGVAGAELGQLAGDLNAMAEALQRRERMITERSDELEASLSELRRTQDELLHSTRLASVGEMAGRTAHEVLNPITSIHGRLTRMHSSSTSTLSENIVALHDVVTGWRDAYERAGLEGLAAELAQPVEHEAGTRRMIVEEDLELLEDLCAWLSTERLGAISDLQFLLREVDRVTHIVDGMRNMTHAYTSPTTFHVGSAVREVFEILRDSAKKRNTELVGSATLREATVHVDRYEMIQVLTNLIRNALQAVEARHGRGGGRVSVEERLTGDFVEIRVGDDGVGIDAAHLPYVFEPSFTTREAQEGTGLGLSISRRMARAWGGELTVERSELGVGTVFLLMVPLDKNQVEGAGAAEVAHGSQ